MGAVYRCRSALSERIRAAVKIIRPQMAAAHGEAAAERFIREAEALHSLRHPAIVRVLGFGHDPTHDLLWLAMELIEGEDLSQRLARGPLPPEQASALFQRYAEGLDHAHQRGIFHRDIKPANLMLTAEGEGVILDFGISLDDGRTRLTGQGVLGTLAYLPTEAFRSGAPLDSCKADVYGLGLVLHEALTGRSAFTEGSSSSSPHGLAQVMAAKLAAGPMDPGEDNPQALRRVVSRSTEPDPRLRLSSMKEMVAILGETGLQPASPRSSEETWLPPDEALSAPSPEPPASLAGPPRTAQPLQPAPAPALRTSPSVRTRAVIVTTLCTVGLGLTALAWYRAESSTSESLGAGSSDETVPVASAPVVDALAAAASQRDSPLLLGLAPIEDVGQMPDQVSALTLHLASRLGELDNVRLVQLTPPAAAQDRAWLAAAGEAAGVDSVLVGGLGRLGGRVLFNLERIDLSTGEVGGRSTLSEEGGIAALLDALDGSLLEVLFGEAEGGSDERVRSVLREQIGQIKFCYEELLSREPTASGRVEVGLSVAPSGAVRELEIWGEIKDPGLRACIDARVQRWLFPASTSGLGKMVFPFVFKPG